MKFLLLFLKKNDFRIGIFLIVLLAFFLRFYNYDSRWGLAYDQAHDALVARYALQHNKIPLVGPFSSAGPFQTGGEWYWFIMLGTVINSHSPQSPWIFLTLLYVFFVYLIIKLGQELKDRSFGLLAGIISAIASDQIAQGINLTNQSLLPFVSLLLIWSAIRYLRTGSNASGFFLGFLTSLGFTIHLQGVSLLLFTIGTLFFRRLKFKALVFFCTGFFIPLTPLLIFDLNNNFLNVRNMIHYYFVDQYKISYEVLDRRWLTYTTQFIPATWTNIVGGTKPLALLVIFLIVGFLIYDVKKRKLSKEWFVLSIGCALMFALLRYIRTPLFASYLSFLHPFILLLSSFAIYRLLKLNKIFGMCLLLAIFFISTYNVIYSAKNAFNYSAVLAKMWQDALLKKYPQNKFAFYDKSYKYVDKSVPLVLYMDTKEKIDDNGMKIGITIDITEEREKDLIIHGDIGSYKVINLSTFSEKELKKQKWVFINPSHIYKTTQEWNKK